MSPAGQLWVFKSEGLDSCYQQRKSSLQLPAQETIELDYAILIFIVMKIGATVVFFPVPELQECLWNEKFPTNLTKIISTNCEGVGKVS